MRCETRCTYSDTLNQSLPRKCMVCGEREIVHPALIPKVPVAVVGPVEPIPTPPQFVPPIVAEAPQIETPTPPQFVPPTEAKAYSAAKGKRN